MKTNDKISLTIKDFSFICPLKSNEMQSIDGGYFCSTCDKKVHDVSDFSQTQYKALFKNKQNICVSFKKITAVSLVLSLSACTSSKPQTLRGEPRPINSSYISENNISHLVKPMREGSP